MPSFSERLRASVAELDRARLEARYADLPVTPIADAPMRRPVRIAGEITSVQAVRSGRSPRLEITIADGTGQATATFLGRRRIAGLRPGGGVLLEGVLRQDRGRRLTLNPLYLLL